MLHFSIGIVLYGQPSPPSRSFTRRRLADTWPVPRCGRLAEHGGGAHCQARPSLARLSKSRMKLAAIRWRPCGSAGHPAGATGIGLALGTVPTVRPVRALLQRQSGGQPARCRQNNHEMPIQPQRAVWRNVRRGARRMSTCRRPDRRRHHQPWLISAALERPFKLSYRSERFSKHPGRTRHGNCRLLMCGPDQRGDLRLTQDMCAQVAAIR